MLPGPSNVLPEDTGVIDAEHKEVAGDSEAENKLEEPEAEEVTEQADKSEAGDYTEGIEDTDDGCEYDEPEEW